MRLQPIFGEFQRDGKNKNGLTMFKCLHCGRRSSWARKEHGHPDKNPQDEVDEEILASIAEEEIKMKPRGPGITNVAEG